MELAGEWVGTGEALNLNLDITVKFALSRSDTNGHFYFEIVPDSRIMNRTQTPLHDFYGYPRLSLFYIHVW